MKFDLTNIKFSHSDIKRDIKLPNKPSTELAEFVGIVLGDGHLHKTQNCITITGSLEDFFYYKYSVIPLIKQLFNITYSFKKRNDRSSYYIFFNSQGIMQFLSKTLNMCRGNKINARIPIFIQKQDSYKKSFLRGLFDTDGCLKFSKQTKKFNYYPRIDIGFKQSDFVWRVIDLVKQLKFNYCVFFDNRNHTQVKFQISGEKNLEKWIKVIDSNNPVQKTKYLFWKKFGYYIPYSGLKMRIEALDLNMENLF